MSKSGLKLLALLMLANQKEFFDTINSNKVNRNILTDGDVEEVVFDNKTLLVFMYPKQIIDSVQYISMEIC